MTTRTTTRAGLGVGTAPSFSARLAAEAAGTFILVFGVIGAAIFGAGFDAGRGGLNIGFLGVALALGLSVFAGASVFGPVSGGHFNPAVTISMALARRLPWRHVGPYIVAQIVGGVVASSILVLIAALGPSGFLASARASGFASTGWGPLSPGDFSLPAAFIVETVTTCVLVWVVLGVTRPAARAASAPLSIGLTLTLVALVAIPISNGSFNPARSIATAIFGGQIALEQLWLSIVAPILGAVIGSFIPGLPRKSGDPTSANAASEANGNNSAA
ncbi:aquaporin [Leifsonia sp. NPDC058248]|uniref:aquaporin n=1 Tax=Leifsonia sp. NPDC058248 TaxID=3346402 RepID=UPI0036DCE1B7